MCVWECSLKHFVVMWYHNENFIWIQSQWTKLNKCEWVKGTQFAAAEITLKDSALNYMFRRVRWWTEVVTFWIVLFQTAAGGILVSELVQATTLSPHNSFSFHAVCRSVLIFPIFLWKGGGSWSHTEFHGFSEWKIPAFSVFLAYVLKFGSFSCHQKPHRSLHFLKKAGAILLQ